METQDHEHLILQFLSGSISEPDRKQFLAWLNESPAHKQEFEEMQKVWNLTKTQPISFKANTEQEWQKLNAALDIVDTRFKKQRYMQWPVLKIAASVALLLVSFLAVYLLLLNPKQTAIASGQQITDVVLPDGSVVTLNKESELTFDKEFKGNQRTVQLKGEAFFKVAHNPQKPFIVVADKIQVKVLGTSFNVRAYKHAAKEVYVATGKVSFSAEDKEVILQPGDKAVADPNGKQLALVPTETPNEIAWTTKTLVFKKTTLAEVIPAIERYFGISITIRNKDLLQCRFTSTFTDPTLPEVLEALRVSLHLEVTGNNKHYTMNGEGC
jgi:transmembrane sensor